MAHRVQAKVADRTHASLVAAVQGVKGSHKYMADAWINFTHEHSHLEEGFNRITLDPWKFSSAFLLDFLQHAKVRNEDTRAIQDFLARPVAKKQRTTYSNAPACREINQVWVVVGDDMLHGKKDFKCEHVALPSNFVHHSGSAVSMLINCMNDRIVDKCLKV